MKRILVATLIALLPAGSAFAQINGPVDDGLVQARRLAAINVEIERPPVIPVLWTTESYNGSCVGLIPALEHWSPGWDVQRMARIAYRESRCDPFASNSCCSGVLQIHRSWIDNVAMCGVRTRADLYDPWLNICAASIVYREQGISAWSTA